MCALLTRDADCPKTLSAKSLAKLSAQMAKCATTKELDAFLKAIERTKALKEVPMHDFYKIFDDIKIMNDQDYKELTKDIYPALRKEKAKYEGVMGTLNKWADQSKASLSKLFGQKAQKPQDIMPNKTNKPSLPKPK
jgi:hypothetical protein